MSSGVESDGIVAAAVVLPVAAAFGVGWLAWQSGKLLIETNRAIDRQIEEKKRQLEQKEHHRKMSAIAAHNQMVDMCSQILPKLRLEQSKSDIKGYAELAQVIADLEEICIKELPDDSSKIESITSLGYIKLDGAVRHQERLARMVLNNSNAGLYQGASVADLMDDLRIAIVAMEVCSTDVSDVAAVDPEILERIRLNEQFASVTTDILNALETIKLLADSYHLTKSGRVWFHSCFNGIDSQIEKLCRPATSNNELKKGIKRLCNSLEQYEIMYPSIESEVRRMDALYKVYLEASRALGEATLNIKEFDCVSELENKLNYLKKRADRAKICADIYRKLGKEAYMCYAWDQELQSMGYNAYKLSKIKEITENNPVHATVGNNKLPYYQWSKEDLTQLYSLSEQCALQVIVHEDGSVSMKTIANEINDEIVHTQEKYCEHLSELHERLKNNWFIIYNYEEKETAQVIRTVSQWKASVDYKWCDGSEIEIQKRRPKRTDHKNMMIE